MSVPKLDGNTELIISLCMVNELEQYLQSDVLYWHVAEPNPLGSHMPQMTIGALCEALTRAEAASNELLPDQRADLAAARARHAQIRAAHAALYVRKARRELQGRLDAWGASLADSGRQTTALYSQDVRVRAKIYLLEKALGADTPPELQKRREQLDRELHKIFVSGEFIWDPRLQAAFPKEPCWWLYGHLLEDHLDD